MPDWQGSTLLPALSDDRRHSVVNSRPMIGTMGVILSGHDGSLGQRALPTMTEYYWGGNQTFHFWLISGCAVSTNPGFALDFPK